MKSQYIVSVPRKYLNRKRELLDYFRKYPPVDLLAKFSGRKYRGKLVIRHKPVGQSADFSEKGTILVDFSNGIEHLFLCVCHELAHLVLRQEPAWYSDFKIRDILDRHNAFRSKLYRYSFKYAIEQTVATFLQAACENSAKIRSLNEFEWRETFEALEIVDFAEVLFPEFKEYLKNLERYSEIDSWVLEMLRKYY